MKIVCIYLINGTVNEKILESFSYSEISNLKIIFMFLINLNKNKNWNIFIF